MPTRQLHEEDNYLASVSDLMVGLLFVFIIILMAFALNLRSSSCERTIWEATTTCFALRRITSSSSEVDRGMSFSRPVIQVIS